MIIDNTAGLQFFLNDDIYLLKQDMDKLDAVLTEPAIAIEEPVIAIKEAFVVIEDPVVAITEAFVVADAPALYFNHLGSNAKQFLILCSYPDAGQMDDKHLTALTSALQRKELALDDVAI